ncbi:hypothetical protein Q1695_014033 [Nippostrongylus brasiliensis]|nr:hypothetical protein Q1695_014033 [Nippostrongylus brasiliensis]
MEFCDDECEKKTILLPAFQTVDESTKVQFNNLKTELVKLFGRLSSVQTLSSKAWKAYASLKRPTDDNLEDADKYIQLMERALLADSNKPNWSKEGDSCYNVLVSATELASERLRLAALRGEAALKQAKSRVRMSLKPLLTVAKRDYDSQSGDGTDERWSDVRKCLEKAENLLEEVAS